ncbi:MAG: glycosyltransferase family 4 protein, partial [Desulfobacterales bacterium]|nr:glycosyltransferase family 4 protein [Desulfobacterales bacterium]
IPPEIVKNDGFYEAIKKIASSEDIKTILEIGSSSGEGSTKAFIEGININPNKPIIFCIEVSENRFSSLKEYYITNNFVKCYNFSSISINDFPDESTIIEFYKNIKGPLNSFPLETILGWLKQDIEYLRNSNVPQNGIKRIKQEHKIDFFDVVLIDGSEFTGMAELDIVYGAKFIFLDDIRTFKNYKNHQRLSSDSHYKMIDFNPNVRNGYSAFKRIENEATLKFFNLPIHFFTIVLNGFPFIQYHIEELKKLPFKWHWHIIEGVAELKHDTSWSLRAGGHVSDKFHKNGVSIDGTYEYLNELSRLYPENITIYRKTNGEFWDGKREMVNAPLVNINEECLLWQIDADELWLSEQICNMRQMFLSQPDKTSAFFWCWYFVGDNLVISSRNCYTQNPKQEWQRVWKFKPGIMIWATHEPPQLAEKLNNGQWRNVGFVNPFSHNETEKQDLIFQHFGYVTIEQLKFKESYYGYKDAVLQWQSLQNEKEFPVLLSNHFGWVNDRTMVNTADSCGIVPLIKKQDNMQWEFYHPQHLEDFYHKPIKIVVDGVFFQLARTGIARVWSSLFEEWLYTGFSRHIIVLDRNGTLPKIPNLSYRKISDFNPDNIDNDRKILQEICNEENADLFISTYYTTPLSTPSVMMAYDMIPEIMGWDPEHIHWRGKHHAINYASAYLTISENTARDLLNFFPTASEKQIIIAHCGVKDIFYPSNSEELNKFRQRFGINKPYFLLIGSISSYKNGILFFKAFSQLADKHNFDIVCTGGHAEINNFKEYTNPSNIYTLNLSDDGLRCAYSGAVSLIFPSKYEGFGLPVLEALACGCPVITCPNSSLPEVAGKAALYVRDDDVDGMVRALTDIQKIEIRQALIYLGLKQAKKFSWTKMAETVGDVLIKSVQSRKKIEKDSYLI